MIYLIYVGFTIEYLALLYIDIKYNDSSYETY